MSTLQHWLLGCLVAVLVPSSASLCADERLIADFEGSDFAGWTTEGEAFGSGPVSGPIQGQMSVDGFIGKQLINSFHQGDQATGSLTSPEFEITHDQLSFLIGGGNLPDQVGVELLINGERQRAATGRDSERLEWRTWDVESLKGSRARMRLFDNATEGWGHITFDHLILDNTVREVPKVERLETYLRSPAAYRERHRPQFHFSAPIHWINDPNGLVYHQGEWHLFYQHNPHGIEWGHMSWGHAVSRDLVHWDHLPIALHEEYGVMAFSGSAVVDHQNSSGLSPTDQPLLVALYTGHGFGKQTQDLAFSLDQGRTWTKYANNPVIDLNEADFRDPKVFWHQPSQQWVMVVTLATQKKLLFYGSKNLKEWERLSEFGPAGTANKPNWECPDLFDLPIENEPGETRWVLEADMGSGSIAGGSGGEYFVGNFDGKEFVPETPESQWVDWGRDFYAPISWSDVPEEDGRRIWIGWLNNWETCLTPTYPFRGAMSLPRQLTLRRINGELRLCQRPVVELQALRQSPTILNDLVLSDETKLLEPQGQQLELILEVEPGTATEFGLRVLSDETHQTEIAYHIERQELSVDRTRSSPKDFDSRFPGKHTGPLTVNEQGTIRLHLFVDTCSVEVFGGHGETVITDLVFPSANADRIELFARGGEIRVRQLEIYPLDSIWKSRQ